MSWSSSNTRPWARAPRMTSCMRLRQRISVLLPQPDGPMMAVICRGATVSDTFSIACRSPYHALNSRTSRRGPASGGGTTDGGDGAISCSDVASRNDLALVWASVREGTHPPANDPAGERAESANQSNKHQSRAPRLRMPIRVRRAGVLVDLNWKGCHRLQQIQIEKLVAECSQ